MTKAIFGKLGCHMFIDSEGIPSGCGLIGWKCLVISATLYRKP